MKNRRHYNKAPIIEALIDIQTEFESPATIESFSSFRQGIEGEYPRERKLYEFTSQINPEADPFEAQTERRQIGFALHGIDEKHIVQVRLNGFTFSRLAPYESWEKFRDEARRIWRKYVESVSPLRVLGVVLRYINKFDIPSGSVNLKDYFSTYPEIAPDMEQTLTGFHMQLQLPQPEIGGSLVLIQTTVSSAPNTVAVILDQGLSKQQPEFIPDEQLWEYLELLRDQKNKIFESCITDKAREIIS